MKILVASLILALLLPAAPAIAGPGDEQGKARKELRAGNIMRIRDIENRIIPAMGGAQYLGFEYDPAMLAYRLKFIRDGRVIFVDVDARSGEVIKHRH